MPKSGLLLEPLQPIPQGHNGADHEQCRRLQTGGLDCGRELGEGSGYRALAAGGAGLDGGGGGGWVLALAQQGLHDGRQALPPHVHDQSARKARQRVPVEQGLVLPRLLVTRDQGDRARGKA